MNLPICDGIAALKAFAWDDSALSREARIAKSDARAVLNRVENSQSLFGRKSATLSQLYALADECNEEDWNGEAAAPISRLAIDIAERVIRALPDHVPLPEFAPEPDGSVSMDWIESSNRLLTLSVGANFRLAYAWLDGTDKGHAVARFDGEQIPPRILETIQSIMGRR